MTPLESLPSWLMGLVAAFLILGSTLTLLGAFGLLHLKSFYDRLHAPTLGTSWGTAATLLASLLSWSWVQDRVILHDLVIGFCIMATTPVTLMFLGRAALHRDRMERREGVPCAVSGGTPNKAAASERTD
ncbi:MAG: monovalent cation/H(+) antiporter subunit G [Albidovulum sp.]